MSLGQGNWPWEQKRIQEVENYNFAAEGDGDDQRFAPGGSAALGARISPGIPPRLPVEQGFSPGCGGIGAGGSLCRCPGAGWGAGFRLPNAPFPLRAET